MIREPDVLVWLPGHPRGKGAPRSRIATTRGGLQFVHHYPDPETKAYEDDIKTAGMKAMVGRLPFDCPLRGRLTAFFRIPKSMPKRDRILAREGIIRPSVKPDDDNILKCRDALRSIVFRDDALFVETLIRKFYGDQPGWKLEVWIWQGTML
jgi:Holliday junction resolvase RusA-like endonuclease